MNKKIAKSLLLALMAYSLVITIFNTFVLGKTSILFIPTTNYLSLIFIWLYYAFDSLFSLGLGILILFSLLCSFFLILGKKNACLPVIVIYFLDIIITIYLLANGRGVLYSLSLIIDPIVIFLAVRAKG